MTCTPWPSAGGPAFPSGAALVGGFTPVEDVGVPGGVVVAELPEFAVPEHAPTRTASTSPASTWVGGRIEAV